MNARELRDLMASGNHASTSFPIEELRLLFAGVSLLASVEESGDEVMKRLNALPIMSDTAKRGAALLVAQRQEIERLRAFRDYFTDRCEGLFFQFGMEVIDLYNATHGYEKCSIKPDRAAYQKETP